MIGKLSTVLTVSPLLLLVLALVAAPAHGQLVITQTNASPSEFFEAIFGLVSGIEITNVEVS